MRVAVAVLALLAGAARADDLVCIQNSNIKVCVDLTRGGSIGYLSAASNTYNVINCHGASRIDLYCLPYNSYVDFMQTWAAKSSFPSMAVGRRASVVVEGAVALRLP